MYRDDIHKLMALLGVEQIADRPQWVSATCPFTPWTHDRQTNLRNSFGISVGESSVFDCFSCKKTGALMNLGNTLYLLSQRDPADIRKFVYTHEHTVSSDTMHSQNIEVVKVMPIPQEEIERRFDSMPPYRSMTQKTIDEWGLKYDREGRRLVIPIRNNKGETIALKGRTLVKDAKPKYLLYTEFNPRDPKSAGVWFGMHNRLVPSKPLLLVEGEIDTMLVKQTGLVHNVWGVMGAGITPAQINTLASVSNPLVFFFDNDKAGHDLKEKLHRALHNLSPHFEITDYRGCNDAGKSVETGRLREVLGSVTKKI